MLELHSKKPIYLNYYRFNVAFSVKFLLKYLYGFEYQIESLCI